MADLKGTKTEANLMAAFAGESQAMKTNMQRSDLNSYMVAVLPTL